MFGIPTVNTTLTKRLAAFLGHETYNMVFVILIWTPKHPSSETQQLQYALLYSFRNDAPPKSNGTRRKHRLDSCTTSVLELYVSIVLELYASIATSRSQGKCWDRRCCVVSNPNRALYLSECRNIHQCRLRHLHEYSTHICGQTRTRCLTGFLQRGSSEHHSCSSWPSKKQGKIKTHCRGTPLSY